MYVIKAIIMDIVKFRILCLHKNNPDEETYNDYTIHVYIATVHLTL